MKMNQLWHVYVRDGIVYVPTMGRTTAGFFIELAPVYTANFEDLAGLREILLKTLRTPNPKVSTPSRFSYPKLTAVAEMAMAKSTREFEKGAGLLEVQLNDGKYTIAPMKNMGRMGWEETPESKITIPATEEIGRIVEKVITVLQPLS